MTTSLRACMRAAWALALLAAACSSPKPAPAPTPVVYQESVQVQDPGSTLPDRWWETAVFYEVHVRSYQDSNGDGYGDLRGLVSRLDHLQALGVTGLYLLPITRNSDHYHGYTSVDLRAVDPDYGTMDDVATLLREAHARGIAVVLDFVGEYTGPQHPFFVDAAQGGGYRSWYLWSDADPGWPHPFTRDAKVWYPSPSGPGYYYSLFFGQPALNYGNPSVRAYVRDTLRFWLNQGVDGFRFDAVGALFVNGPSAQIDQPENHAYDQALRRDVLDAYARRFTVAENGWDPTAYLGDGSNEFHSGFSFPYAQAVMGAIAAADATGLAGAVAAAGAAPPGARYATLLTNHDVAGVRAFTRFGGDEARCKLAATVLLTSPGIPFVYYGEEIGMKVLEPGQYDGKPAPWADETYRSPMQWDGSPAAGFTTGTPYLGINTNHAAYNVAAEAADPGSILAHFRRLIAARRGEDALLRGGTAPAGTSDPGATAAWVRTAGARHVAVIVNLSAEARTVRIDLSGTPLDVAAGSAGGAPDLLDGSASPGDVTPANAHAYPVTVPARGARVLPFTY